MSKKIGQKIHTLLGALLIAQPTAYALSSAVVTLSGTIPAIQEVSLSTTNFSSPTSSFTVGSNQTYLLSFPSATLAYATNAAVPQIIQATLTTPPARGSVLVAVSGISNTGLLTGAKPGTAAAQPVTLSTAGSSATLINQIQWVNNSANIGFSFALDMTQPPGPLTSTVTVTMLASS
ncbi:MAG: hypothetical protein ACOYKZ_00165 [Chlamydiia bacterium]